MNKYQEALNKVYEIISDLDFGSQKECAIQLKIIQELVDKETPMKVDKIDWTPTVIYRCVKCSKKITNGNYCINCGQKLDWSEEDLDFICEVEDDGIRTFNNINKISK